MRRPHVYERSAPRVRHRMEGAPTADYGPAALAAIGALPALLRQAEDAGAAVLARHLGQALTEAEGIVRRADRLGPLPPLSPVELTPCSVGRRQRSSGEVG